MSLSALTSSSSVTSVTQIRPTSTIEKVVKSSDTSATGGGAAGAYMVQPDAAQNNGSLLKKVLVGGAVGAGLGFAASFVTPIVNVVTTVIPAAWPIKIAMAGVGAVLGAGAAAVMHFVGKKNNLGMQANEQQQAVQQSANAPTPITPSGPTIRIGSQGTGTRELQKNLKAIGMFPHQVSGKFDKPTANAVRRYEVLKGVVPTGLGTPELRDAVKQDAMLVKQNV